MVIFILAMVACSIGQFILCGFTFEFLLCLAGRVMFLGKLYGMHVQLKAMAGLEGAGLFWMAFIHILFKIPVSPVSVIAQVIFSIICVILEWYDDTFFVYIEEEIKSDKKE